MEGSDRQLSRLCAYGLFTFPFAGIPFLFFYFQDHGVEREQYLLLIAIYYWSMVALEIPTGLVADRFGRRLSLVAGSTILAAAFFTIWAGDSFAEFCIAEILFGLGHALLSGAPTAILYDSLRDRGEIEDFLVAESRVHAYRLFGTGGSFLLGGALAYLYGIGVAILLSGGLCLTGATIALTLRETRRPTGARPALLRGAMMDLRAPALVWVVVYYVLLFGLLRFAFHTYQPYFEDTVFDTQHRPWNWIVLGTLFCALNLVAAPCSRLAPQLLARFRYRTLFFWMPTTLCAAFLLMSLLPNWIGVLLFLVHQVPFGLHWGIVQEFVNHRVDSASRATALSVISFTGRISFAAWFPLIALGEGSRDMTVAYWTVALAGFAGTLIWCLPWLGGRLLARTQT